ncbi:hypothetical protein BFG57_11440 [Bacillus solimangrovi]|uniref:Right handed beta helix domain-containing protein n=1 Tax=Bacillus solimangrovi TaxID=1305675 RepID=A0A1E5LIA2_9BACI|nr:hypothetical protein BFG57_11440 [Bacillus solimangrovi]
MENLNLNKFILIIIIIVPLVFTAIIASIGLIFINNRIIMVPEQFPIIQAAVAEAQPGDIILVKDKGEPYEEAVTINTDNIKLIGIGKVKPVLDGLELLEDGITIGDTSGVQVSNFIIQNYLGNGIEINNSDEITVNRNMVKDNGDNGIDLNDNTRNSWIKNNIAMRNMSDGIDLDDSTNNVIKGNTATNNMRHGILSETSNNNIYKGNIIKDNIVDEGIHLINSIGNTVTRNRVENNGSEGIELSDNSDLGTVKGNYVRNNSVNGILINGSTFSTINSNVVINNTENGILFNDNSNNNDGFFNVALGNGNGLNTFDINDQNITPPINNLKANICITSYPAGLCK